MSVIYAFLPSYAQRSFFLFDCILFGCKGVSGAPLDPTAPFVWRCAVFGPSDTAWEGGVFQLQMQFGADYPQKPPNVRFISKMFHPNGQTLDA